MILLGKYAYSPLYRLICGFLLLFCGWAYLPHTNIAYGATTPTAVISLADLGYNSDIALQGARPNTSFSFPLPEAGISDGRLTLGLQISQIVDSQATIQINLNDQPTLTLTADELRQQPTVTLPITVTSEPYLTVQVTSDLTSHQNSCTVLDNGLWVTIARSSALTYHPLGEPENIRSFLDLPGGTIRVQGLWDTPQHREASIALVSTLEHLYRNAPTTVFLAEDATDSDRLTRTIVVRENEPPMALEQGQLIIAPQLAAIQALQTEAGEILLLGTSLPTISDVDTTPVTQSNIRTLQMLGISDQRRDGSGELPISLRFTLADIGGWPTNLRFQLQSAFDEISTSARERALLRVRLNGTLLETFDLRGRSTLQQEIALPSSLLRSENFLETSFVYAPETGECLGSPFTFSGEIHANSALVWDGLDTSRQQIGELIGTFGSQGQLIVIDNSEEAARTAARLVGGLSRYTATALTPQLADTSALTTTPAAGNYRIVLGGDSTTAQTLKLPVDITQNVTITDPHTGEVVLHGQSGQPLASIQYQGESTPTLAVQYSTTMPHATLDMAITQMVEETNFFAIDGNVLISDGQQTIALDLANRALQIETPVTTARWSDWLWQYRWFLLIPAALLVALCSWLLYQRLGKRPTLPASSSEALPSETDK